MTGGGPADDAVVAEARDADERDTNRDGSTAESTLGDASVVFALFAATITLLGAARPVRSGDVDPLFVAVAVLAVLALAGVFGVRYDLGGRSVLAPFVALSSLGVGLLSMYGLNQGYVASFGVPPLADAPTLLVTLVGSGLTVAAAAAAYAELSAEQLERRALGATRYTLLGAVGFLSITIYANLLAVVFLVGTGTLINDLPETSQTVFTQAATVLGMGTVTVAFLAWTGRDRSFVDVRVPSLRDLGYVVGGIVALGGIAILIGMLLGATGAEGTEHSSFERAQGAPELLLVLAAASILVIGPFEELLYRNVIQKGLYEYFSKPGAVVVASVVFASAHLVAYSGGSVGQLLVSLSVVFALSLALGTLYARTGNLLVPALVHGLYNAYTYVTAYITLTA